MIKVVQTIAQYSILRWIDHNFMPESVNVEFVNSDSPIITDRVEDTLRIRYSP